MVLVTKQGTGGIGLEGVESGLQQILNPTLSSSSETNTLKTTLYPTYVL
jgi:hypothetical protein